MKKKKVSRKRWLLILIILLVSAWLILTAWYLTRAPESLGYCDTDSDCACYDGCLCVNKNYAGAIACPQMAACTKFNYCECVDNKCETKLNRRICDSDDECILVQDGCCSCSWGGKNTAVNKAHLEWWNSKIASECKDVMCPAVISNDPTCFSEPKCINGECRPVPK